MRKVLQWYDDEYPQKLLKIKDAPNKLHVEGKVELMNNSIGIVGIVGSRNSTEYGRKYARIFAEYLSKKGITIISGMALGVDTEAHLGSLKGEGNTIAVLGSGLNNVTPEENLWLYNKIINEGGLVISEKDDDEFAKSSGYQKRNRIISGIADAVLVIEASKRSGSRITARYAKSQGKKVLCIPNSLDSENIAGIKELIIDGAQIVTSVNQLVSEIYTTKEKDVEKPIILDKDRLDSISNIPPEYKEIYNILEYTMSKEEIAMKLKRGMDEINSIITMMELYGYIEQVGVNNFKRA